MDQPRKVGLIGCGAISNAYFRGSAPFDVVKIVACADIDQAKAQVKAQEHSIRACSVEELLRDPSLDIVLNLTVPKAHTSVNRAALDAGKHVYCEKPLALTRDEGRQVLDLALRKELRIGCAPDTFLGGGIQTARKLIDDGVIGTPVAATAFLMCHGHERWHPSPEFYYERGGGPMLDMGPYYVTALVNLIGPIKRVTGSTRITFPERTITSQPKAGKKIVVETPTHLAGVLDFANGAVGTIITSFDVWKHHLPCIEIHGTEGSLSVPDPNCFGGEVQLFRPDTEGWQTVPLTHSGEVGRGIGLADMAQGSITGRPHRVNGELAYHVLDVMLAFEDASIAGQHVAIQSTCAQPAALPVGLKAGELD